MHKMEGRKVVVTGATRGIGAEIAQAFADYGANVIGTRTTHTECSDSPCKKWLIADFSNLSQLYECASEVKAIAPDVLINNAGINKIGQFTKISPEDFLLIQQVNVFAPFLLCQSVIPSMRNHKWGRIVNISSIWGQIGKEFRASYSTSKFALDGMTLAIAAEHSHNGILANCVAPGFTDTELTRRVLGEEEIRNISAMVPIHRMATTKEIASFVTWLASDENTYITGQNITIDGGFTRV